MPTVPYSNLVNVSTTDNRQPSHNFNMNYGDAGYQAGNVAPQVSPTAPDLGQWERIPGYEGIGFKEEVLVPPSVPVWQPEQQDRTPMQQLQPLSEEEVREAALQYASEHCCYRSAAAREMQMNEIQMMSAFHYTLETFAEKRESAWKFVPYTGQAIDGPQNGPAPPAWSMPATPAANFANGNIRTEVPHTAFVKPCHTCVGNCRVRCERCFGNGRRECTWCNGRGRRRRFDNDEFCDSCNGTGFDRCISCNATGQVQCSTCSGRGNLKAYVELIVTWTNHLEDYISETSTLPKELIRQVSGQIAYQEENPRVFPIMHASDQAVRAASDQLVSKHAAAFPNERILRQRQTLRIIPISHVRYQFKSKSDEFFVYGFEHKVYFNKYPQKCCCIIA